MREQERLEFYEFVRSQWGDTQAGTLMDLLPPVDYGELATKRDLAELRVELGERFNEMTRTILLALVPMWFTAIGLAVAISALIKA